MTELNIKTAHYLSNLIGFAKQQGYSPSELARWSIAHIEESGFYSMAGQGLIRRFVDEFVMGRRGLYERVEQLEFDNRFEVRSQIWHRRNPPQAFLFFDVDSQDLCDYGKALALLHAERLGVKTEISIENEVELAVVSKEL
jgi:hypothetical protein